MKVVPVGSSFRDPSGFLYRSGGTLLRQVNRSYAEHYDAFVASGLYDELTACGLLVSHDEVDLGLAAEPDHAYRVLRPEPIPVVTYPFEWCFGQLRQAAVTTLEILRRALARGMVLKDASAYNVQFVGAHAVFIDTLSFERYREGEPWIAYRQFCQHFLAPLLLASSVDASFLKTMRIHLDGIPLALASKLLSRRSWFRVSTLLHIHLHARALDRYSDTSDVERKTRGASVSRTGLEGLIASLQGGVERLRAPSARTEWGDYEVEHGYSAEAQRAKDGAVRELVQRADPDEVWDLGANTGRYSRIAAEVAPRVVSLDVDPRAVEKNFERAREEAQERVLPLVIDLTDPTPPLGFGLSEWLGIHERGRPDLFMALALIHHLAIGGNLPLERIARLWAERVPWVLVEWVPKEDPQVRRLLSAREDIFPEYTQEGFEAAFAAVWVIEERRPLVESRRVLYLWRRTAG